MKAGEWREEHSALLKDAGADPGADATDLDAMWEQIARRIDAAPRRDRRRRAVAIVAASAVLVGGGTVAAAASGMFSARTGGYVSEQEVRKAGPGEVLDFAGDDFGQVTLEETADIPFPSEEARSISAQFQIDDHPPGMGQVSTGALRGFVANDAICSWSNAWARAVADGDESAATAAASMLNGAGDWPAVKALDSELSTRSTTVHFPNGKSRTVNDPTRFYYLRLVQEAVQAGDVDELGAVLTQGVFCVPALMPDLPQAVPERRRQ